MNTRSLFLSALTAGGIVSILLVLCTVALIAFMVNPTPVSNALDENLVALSCGCAGFPMFVVNGALGAFLYRRREGNVSGAHGALAGALSGLVGAIVTSLCILIGLLLVYSMITGWAGPGEVIKEFTGGYFASVGLYVAYLVASVIFWSLMGALGGLIGAVIFRKTGGTPTP